MRFLSLLVFAAAVFSLGAPQTPLASARNVDPASPVIVVLRSGTSPDAVASRNGVAAKQRYTYALNGFSADATVVAVSGLALDADVLAVVTDASVALVPVTEDSASSTSSSNVPTGVNRIDAEQATLGSGSVNVAVIDTGSGPHKDLVVARRVNCLLPGCPAGGDDDNGHGSHVAGTIGGKVKGGARGVAPSVPITSVKVVDAAGNGSVSNIIAGLDVVTGWKQSLGGQWVANMSLALGGKDVGTCDATPGKPQNDPLHAAVCNATRAGVVIVAASGNAAGSAFKTVPAAYDEVLTVAAVTDYDGKGGHLGVPPLVGDPPHPCDHGPDDTILSESNSGKDIDLAAPGACIFSLYLNNAYRTMTGTSMAAAHVTGAVALKMASGALNVSASSDPAAARNAADAALGTQPESDPFCGFTNPNGTEPLIYVGQPLANCQ